MTVQSTIETKIREHFSPEELRVENESHMHGGPATESHFKLTVVADDFNGLSPVKRHQQVYGVLADELAGGVHALALHLYSPEEWQQRQDQGKAQAPLSPDCRGGSKHDK